jgi:hypothetical protein
MGTFIGTKRNEYTKDKVRNMRSERKGRKAKVAGVSDKDFQYYLGDLIGAGHLKLEGFRKMETDIANDITPLGNALGMGNNVVMRHNIEFQSYKHSDRDGVRPHLTGYLASGHPNDPHFKLKGWINEDGSVRIELVK